MQNLFRLSIEDMEVIGHVIDDLCRKHTSVESHDFVNDCVEATRKLPLNLLRQLQAFRRCELPGGELLIQGYYLDDSHIGPTPETWDAPWSDVPYQRAEIYQCLLGSCVGEIFSYSTLENGRFLRHLVPEQKSENDQTGASSKLTLQWHNEETWHPCRNDFQILMCYRNKERALTNIAACERLDLRDEDWEILRQPRFVTPPDVAHYPEQYNESSQWQTRANYENIIALFNNPPRHAVITGSQAVPMVAFDQTYTRAQANDPVAADVLKKLGDAMEQANCPVELRPGDVLIFDNKRITHGRSAFTPVYGPEKRWLRILYTTADLRKSLAYRPDPRLRVLA